MGTPDQPWRPPGDGLGYFHRHHALPLPPSWTRLSPSLLMRMARTLLIPQLKAPAKGPVPSVPVSPKTQGGNRGHSHKTTLSSPPAPPRPAPSAVPRMWSLQHLPRWVHSWGRLTKKEGAEAQPQPGPPPPALHPTCILHPSPRPACGRDPVASERPLSDSLPGQMWDFGGLKASGTQGGGAKLRGQRLARAWWVRVVYSQCNYSQAGLQQPLAAMCTRRSPRGGLHSKAPSPNPCPRSSALVALQTHISEAVPVLDLAAVLRDGRQPLLVLHEIAGGLALFDPFGVAFSQGGCGQEQQRQCQRSAAWGMHPGLGSTWGGGSLDFCSILMSFLPRHSWQSKRCRLPQPSSFGLTPVTDGWIVGRG